MSRNLLYGPKCLWPIRQLRGPLSVGLNCVHKQFYSNHPKSFTFFPSSSSAVLSKKIKFATEFGIESRNITTTSLLGALQMGKNTSEFSGIEIQEQIGRFVTDSNNLLPFLKTGSNSQLNEESLTSIIQLLWNYLRDSQSGSKEEIIQKCIGHLYMPITKNLKALDTNSIIRLLEIMVHLRAPYDHAVLFSMLNLLSHTHRGHLTLHQLAYLETILQKLHPVSESPLATQLQSTLALNFERKLNTPLEPKDLELLTQDKDRNLAWLPSPCDQGLVQSLVDDILAGILHLNHIQACNLLLFFTDCSVTRNVEGVDKLLLILFKIMADKIQAVDSDHLAILVSRCAEKFEAGEENFYNGDFMNSLHTNDIRIIQAASIMGHVDERFLYSVSTLAELPGRLMNPDLLLAYLRLFATAGCQPFHMDHFLEHKILDHAAQTVFSPHLNVSLALDLLAMESMPRSEFVEKIFQPQQMNADAQGGTISLEECGLRNVGYGPIPLLLLNRALVALHPHPSYDGFLPSLEELKMLQGAARAQTTKWQYPLTVSLSNALGGPQFFVTDIWHCGIHIDHCVVINKEDGSPLKISGHFNLDNFPETNKLPILLKVHPKLHYTAHMKKLRGIYELESRILKTFGFPLIEVNLVEWTAKREEERARWLLGVIAHEWRVTK